MIWRGMDKEVRKWAFCFIFKKVCSIFFFLARFHFGACVVPQKSAKMECQLHGKCLYWECERVWGCAERVKGGKKTEIELFESLFWAPLPLLQMSIYSPPSSKCWGCRWPSEESTYQSLPGHLPICLPIYSSAHLMTIHPVHSTILLPPLHLLDNQSINTSICAPIQQFISPSFIYLSIIYPSIHPHTPACFHQFPAAP